MSVTMTESARPNTISPTVFGKSELEAIDAAVLLLIGDRERLYDPRATIELAAERMPGLSGEIVPNAHHLAALAQPDDVNDRITRFLTRGQVAQRPG
jgi:pimeloyl-ACP methyl ester carboxylesterase